MSFSRFRVGVKEPTAHEIAKMQDSDARAASETRKECKRCAPLLAIYRARCRMVDGESKATCSAPGREVSIFVRVRRSLNTKSSWLQIRYAMSARVSHGDRNRDQVRAHGGLRRGVLVLGAR